jgi:hypothetical protein
MLAGRAAVPRVFLNIKYLKIYKRGEVRAQNAAVLLQRGAEQKRGRRE